MHVGLVKGIAKSIPPLSYCIISAKTFRHQHNLKNADTRNKYTTYNHIIIKKDKFQDIFET